MLKQENDGLPCCGVEGKSMMKKKNDDVAQ
jgi:hypothetical protein